MFAIPAWVAGVAVVLVALSQAGAQSLAGMTKAQAVLVFDGSASEQTRCRPWAVAGPVRCQAGQRVGAWVESPTPVTLRSMQVDGCDVGVVVQASPGQVSGAHAVDGLAVTGCHVGIWEAGLATVITGATIQGCQYGMVVDSRAATIQGNYIADSGLDGILLLGGGQSAQRQHDPALWSPWHQRRDDGAPYCGRHVPAESAAGRGWQPDHGQYGAREPLLGFAPVAHGLLGDMERMVRQRVQDAEFVPELGG